MCPKGQKPDRNNKCREEVLILEENVRLLSTLLRLIGFIVLFFILNFNSEMLSDHQPYAVVDKDQMPTAVAVRYSEQTPAPKPMAISKPYD